MQYYSVVEVQYGVYVVVFRYFVCVSDFDVLDVEYDLSCLGCLSYIAILR